jgi:hypothetical protein
MSKRHGAVHVGAYIVSANTRYLDLVDVICQERGWESDAILNWLALAGWGVSYDEPAPNSEHTPGATADLGSAKSGHKHEAPDSTTVMSLPELIRDVRRHLKPLGFHLWHFCAVRHQRTHAPSLRARPAQTGAHQPTASRANVGRTERSPDPRRKARTRGASCIS